MGIIYCFTNKINNKKYIGQTVNPNHRYVQHKSVAFNEKDPSYNTPFHAAIRKYGWENFNYEVLISEIDDFNILNQLEIYYIDKYNTKVPNGYNIQAGGKNAPKPKDSEWRKKLIWAQAKLTEEEVIALRKAYANHESPTLIYKEKYSERLNYQAFLNIWCGRRYKEIMPEVFNDKGRHTKLTKQLAHQIKEERKKTNLSYKKIGEKFGVSSSTVADIIKGRTWKDA